MRLLAMVKGLSILSTILLVFCVETVAQVYSKDESDSNNLEGTVFRTRYLAWVTPTGKNHVTINGIAVGLMAMPQPKGELIINGLNIEILPIAILTIPGSMIGTTISLWDTSYFEELPKKIRTKIHGLSIGGGMFEGVEMHGYSLNINSYISFSHGLEMSLWMNSNYLFSGVQLSFWGNRAVVGKGLQLGLFNSCKDCRGFQVGLLNRMGKRVLPLINFNLKKQIPAN